MNTDRRAFIRHSLVVLGAAVAGSSSPARARKGSSSCCGGSCGVLAVSATGAVVGSAANADAQNGSARIGTPGRKWVMVIDLAKEGD